MSASDSLAIPSYRKPFASSVRWWTRRRPSPPHPIPWSSSEPRGCVPRGFPVLLVALPSGVEPSPDT